MENIFEKTIFEKTIKKWYRNYLNLTKKQKKLNVVRRAVEIIKDQLKDVIDNIRIRWITEKGEAKAIINLSTSGKIASLLHEIWKYLYPKYNIQGISVIVTTYDITNEISPNTNEYARLVFQTDIYTEKDSLGCYSNYIPLTKYVDDDITVHIYLVIDDREEDDDY